MASPREEIEVGSETDRSFAPNAISELGTERAGTPATEDPNMNSAQELSSSSGNIAPSEFVQDRDNGQQTVQTDSASSLQQHHQRRPNTLTNLQVEKKSPLLSSSSRTPSGVLPQPSEVPSPFQLVPVTPAGGFQPDYVLASHQISPVGLGGGDTAASASLPPPVACATPEPRLERIAIVGSGAWGSTLALFVGENVANKGERFDREVRMWVFEEQIAGRNLSDIINSEHCNVKYLPTRKLPDNILAVPNLESAVEKASILIFVLPFPFHSVILSKIAASISPSCRAVLAVWGLDFCEDGSVRLLSDILSQGLNNIDVSVLLCSGKLPSSSELFMDATIACSTPENSQVLHSLFHSPPFRINMIADKAGAELFGHLKSIIPFSFGICDGLGFGSSTKASCVRLCLQDLHRFASLNFGAVERETFLSSCSLSDAFACCIESRTVHLVADFVRSKKPMPTILHECGDRLPVVRTLQQMSMCLDKKGWREQLPVLSQLTLIIEGKMPLASFLKQC